MFLCFFFGWTKLFHFFFRSFLLSFVFDDHSVRCLAERNMSKISFLPNEDPVDGCPLIKFDRVNLGSEGLFLSNQSLLLTNYRLLCVEHDKSPVFKARSLTASTLLPSSSKHIHTYTIVCVCAHALSLSLDPNVGLTLLQITSLKSYWDTSTRLEAEILRKIKRVSKSNFT